MKNIRAFSIVLIITQLMGISCKSDSRTNEPKVPETPELTNNSTESQQEKGLLQEEKAKELKAIDFFGIKLQGQYDDMLDKIYALPILSLTERHDTMKEQHNGVMCFSHIVEFCGVPCGMNVRYRMNTKDEMYVHDLCFITSQTDDDIIHRFVSELTKYYGAPDVSDEREDSYHWSLPSGLCVRARHFHTPEGGWTVFFYY